MSSSGPVVDDDGVTFRLTDHNRRLASVRLVQDLGLGGVAFERAGVQWSLLVPRPPVDRMEYLFEVEDHNGNRTTIPDPGSTRRAPGAFGEKSVLEFADYRTPAWLGADAVPGARAGFAVEAAALRGAVTGEVWSPASLSPTEAAPLLVVHDGPEYDALGAMVQFVAAGIARGAIVPLRVALVSPGERNEWYAANPTYAAALVDEVLPALPASTGRIGVGVSLGGLAMLHAHRTRPGTFDGLFLQSGSFFTPALDGQESAFGGFAAVTGFVEELHAATGEAAPVPTVLTCGVPEENLANNRRMSETLSRLGYPVSMIPVRDGHNYTAWRDALEPHLTELLAAVTHAP